MFFWNSHYYLILLLQGICVAHVIKTGRNYSWIWLIVFAPVIGVVIYAWFEILPDFRLRELPSIELPVFQKMKIREYEERLKELDTVTNRVNLAELYAKYNRQQEALALIKDCLAGPSRNDFYVLLTYAIILFQNKNYEECNTVLDTLEEKSATERGKERRLLRARVYKQLGRKQEAEEIFKKIASRFDGEEARYWYANFLLGEGRLPEAREIVQEGIRVYKRSGRIYKRAEHYWYTGLKLLSKKLKKEIEL